MIATGLALLLALVGGAQDGLTRVRSDAGVAETVARLDRAARERRLTVFATVDHAANARAAGLTLRPTVVLIVGNPQVGTRLMDCGQEIAIDLPLKLLVWEDANGAVWIGYTPPRRLAERHGLQGCDEVVTQVEAGLGALAKAAAGG
jgi:uncharacterized protein (DUF302 family)